MRGGPVRRGGVQRSNLGPPDQRGRRRRIEQWIELGQQLRIEQRLQLRKQLRIDLLSQPAWAATPAITLPFAFSSYGASVTQVWLQNQGTIGMGAPPTSPVPTSFPSCSVANTTTRCAALVAFGDAQLVTSAQGVCAATMGTAPNRRYVVTWYQALDTSDVGSQLTFSVALSETTDTIDLLYGTAQGPSGLDATVAGSTATVGIQSYQSGSLEYTAYSCDKAFIAAVPLDVRFTPN